MALDYYLEPNTLAGAEPGTYRIIVTQTEGAEGVDFVKMAAKTLNKSEGETTGIIQGLAQTADTLLRQGWNFNLPGFGTFEMSMKGIVHGADGALDSTNIVRVTFRVDKTLTAAAQAATKNRLHGVVHGPVIDAVIDQATNTTNAALTPNGNIRVPGRGLKISGDAATIGIALLDADGDPIDVPPAAISRNSPTELIFICPNLTAGTYKLRVTTQYSTGNTLTAAARSYTFEQELTVS
jgi:nucleoid DNA-binding protein